MAGKKSVRVAGVPPLLVVIVVGAFVAIAQDIVKTETESILKRNGWWPKT